MLEIRLPSTLDSSAGVSGVSFIVTVYDKAAHLPRIIESLARQTGSFPREFIFVDDGSSDDSVETFGA